MTTPTAKTPLKREDASKFTTLIKNIESDEDSYEFRQPVDFKNLGLTDYPKIIKTPMDLSSIKKKLKNGKYEYHEEILGDIQLIWDNCKTYNMANSYIYLQAEKMERFVKKQIANLKLGLLSKGGAGGKGKGKKGGHDEDDDGDSSDGEGQDGDIDSITIEEKIRLGENIRALDNVGLEQLVRLIEKECPKAIEQTDQFKLQIKVDEIDRRTFNNLEELISSSLKEKDLEPAHKRQKLA
mmetsp:Transcript_60691/g.69337  ORF Transcript_60691/g.69337 Transcript_60691/m.69337 type:complete len:239 (-) Transcript_60691:389-1105(-)|eukprot:CAMPEP_0115006406 /NCGR_PEP_ID=MMETSP0216-20121206/20488_1 /TAXON_ID=223996 /ORGANISM="Protocruzia adherens, Strain Boccale" /LENGTH=238 /DNA_ID=CAMNT_0002372997 /DNA_START=117 /DNA_END=833 /DNA_ORIENTATION=-